MQSHMPMKDLEINSTLERKEQQEQTRKPDDWYSDEEMRSLLHAYLGDNRYPDLIILDPINAFQYEGQTLAENLRSQLFQETLSLSEGHFAKTKIIIPVNLGHLHWVGLYIYFNTENRQKPLIGYFDPLGQDIPAELWGALLQAYPDLAVEDVMRSPIQLQHDNYNCGPWVVAILESLIPRGSLPAIDLNIQERRLLDAQILTRQSLLKSHSKKIEAVNNKSTSSILMPEREKPLSAAPLPLPEAGTPLPIASAGDMEKDLYADGPSGYTHRVFISHRGTQKEEVAFPIMAIFSYFCGPHFAAFDEVTLELGEENRTVISKALSESAHCLVLVSSDFFESKWPLKEVDAFFKAIEKKGAQGQRKIIPFFIGLSPDACGSVDMSSYRNNGEPLSEKDMQRRRRVATKLSQLSGRERVQVKAPEESVQDFILKHMPDLIENELRGRHPALLPEFNRVDPQLMADIYKEAVAYKKAKGKVNAWCLREFVRELKARTPQMDSPHSPLVIKHLVSGSGIGNESHVEYGSDDLPSSTPAELFLQLHREKMQLLLSSQRAVHVEHRFDNTQPIGRASTGVFNMRVNPKEAQRFSASENSPAEAAAMRMDQMSTQKKDRDQEQLLSRHLSSLEASSAIPVVAAPKITWYFSKGARVSTFQLRVENRLWQVDFENLCLPVFSPLLQQGAIIPSHQLAHEVLCDYLCPVKEEEAGRIILILGLAGLGKSRLVQHYLYQQAKVPAKERHPMIAWLSGQSEEVFETQWKALADQFRAIDSTLNEAEDSAVIKKWFEEHQSNWLLVIDDWQSLAVEKVLSQLPSKGGHIVITTRYPATYFDQREIKSHARILLDLKLKPLSVEESKKLIEAHFGAHWKVMGHKEETQALDQLVHHIGGFPQALVQAATHIRKKSISFSRYMTQFTHSPALQWQLLSDTVLGTFDRTETMAYQWGSAKELLIERLYQAFPGVEKAVHAAVLTAWLQQMASLIPSLFIKEQKKEENSLAGQTGVFSSEFLKQQWQSRITAEFPVLRERIDVEQLWTVYQTNLSNYLPLDFSSPEEKPIFASPVVQHVCLNGFPIANSSSAMSLNNPLTAESEEAFIKEVKEKREKEQQAASVPLNYNVFLGENARVGHLRSAILVGGSPDALRAWQLPTQNKDFIPRPDAMNDLAQKLAVVNSADQNARQVVLTTAVSGMGGVGKTELARHYVHHSKHTQNEALSRDYQRRFWFDASSLSQLSISFRELGLALQLIEPKDDDREVRKRIHQWLQLHPGWLVVFDNADDYPAVAEWVPAKGGTVLITTREHAPGQLPDEQIVRVTVLEEQEAVQWLYQLSHRDTPLLSIEEKSAVAELVKHLGYLPLAIVQVAAYLRLHPEILIADYLKKFISDRMGSLSEGTWGESKHETDIQKNDSDALARKIVARTWDISLRAMQYTADKQGRPNRAEHLLTLCAYLAPTPIPIFLLEGWLGQTLAHQAVDKILLGYSLDEYLSELLRYALVQRDAYVNTVSVHRLVQEVIRYKDRITLEAIFSERLSPIEKILSLSFPIAITHRAEITLQNQLIPHLEQLLSHLVMRRSSLGESKEQQKACIELWQALGCAYQDKGSLPKAVEYFKAALENYVCIEEPGHLYVAKIRNHLACALRAQGNSRAAIEQLKIALESDLYAYGPNDERVLITCSNMGEALIEQGDWEGAIEHFKACLESAHGSTSLFVAGGHFGLGVAFKAKGYFKKAIKHLQIALDSSLNTKESDRFVTRIRNQLGEVLLEQGNEKGAAEQFKAALESDLHIYGVAHPIVAGDRLLLGTALRAQGDMKEAFKHVYAAFDIFLNTFGPNHPNVASVRNHLGSVFAAQGDLKSGIEHFKAALEINLGTYEPSHYAVAGTRLNLGTALAAQGDLKGAIEHFHAALHTFAPIYGWDHPKVALTRANLGTALHDQGDLEGAAQQYKAVLEINLRSYESDHPHVVLVRTNLGTVLHDQGDLEGAAEQYKAALEMGLRIHGSDHSQVRRTLDVLQKVQDQKNFEGALEQFQTAFIDEPEEFKIEEGMIKEFQTALENNLRMYEADHPNVIISRNTLGEALKAQGNLKEANKHFKIAFESTQRMMEHLTLAQPYRDLLSEIRTCMQVQGNNTHKSAPEFKEEGNALLKKGKYHAALEKFNKALEITPAYPNAWNSKGIAHRRLKHYAEALYAFDQAIRYNPDYELAKRNKNELERILQSSSPARGALQSNSDFPRVPTPFSQGMERASTLSRLMRMRNTLFNPTPSDKPVESVEEKQQLEKQVRGGVEPQPYPVVSNGSLSFNHPALERRPSASGSKGNPDQEQRGVPSMTDSVWMSSNIFSYWNKYKEPLGVAVSAAMVGIAAVYMESIKLWGVGCE